MARSDLASEDLLRGFARLLAPYLADELKGHAQAKPDVASASDRKPYDAPGAAEFVADLPRELTENALVLFEALQAPPYRIDASTLVDLLGAVNGREIAGLLTTPLKRRAKRLGFGDPPWVTEESGSGHKVWVDRDGNAARVYKALKARSDALRRRDPATPEQLLAHPDTRRPAPSTVYAWAPEYAEFAPGDEDRVQGASCLRSDRPGTRAVIYRSHEEQGIVALFDVGLYPKESDDWGWWTEGYIHRVDPPITRVELLDNHELNRVFAHIQNRRRLPSGAQQAMASLLITRFPNGQLPKFRPLEPKRKRRR